MERPKRCNQKGITLIELLIGLVICGVLVGGIYRLFVAQTRAYTVQDQVAEVQQGVRSAMEILLRDLRMTGYDSDSVASKISVPNPIVAGDNTITISYEYDPTTRHAVNYSRDPGTARLLRQLTTTKDDGTTVVNPTEILLENVDALTFTYGVDANGDGAMDEVDRNGDGIIDYRDLMPSAGIGMAKVVAVRVVLSARPPPMIDDLRNVSPRTLDSIVTFRNMAMTK